MENEDAPRITIPPLTDAEIAEMKPGNVTWKPSHPFTPDVVAWAEVDRWDDGPDVTISATFARKLSRQILAAVGRV